MNYLVRNLSIALLAISIFTSSIAAAESNTNMEQKPFPQCEFAATSVFAFFTFAGLAAVNWRHGGVPQKMMALFLVGLDTYVAPHVIRHVRNCLDPELNF